MNNTSLTPWVRSVAIATIAVSVMLAALIVSAEEFPALKNWLKATFYHHWLGKGALALLLFAAVGVAFKFKRNAPNLTAIIAAEAIVVALSALAIAGFFLLHLLHFIR